MLSTKFFLLYHKITKSASITNGCQSTTMILISHASFLMSWKIMCSFLNSRQQFVKNWMNTKVMKWRYMHQASIWQGRISICMNFMILAIWYFFLRENKNVTNHCVRIKSNSVCLQRIVLNRQNATQLKVRLVPVVSHRAWQAFLVAQMIKESICNAGDLDLSPWVGWEDALEKGMAGYPL